MRTLKAVYNLDAVSCLFTVGVYIVNDLMHVHDESRMRKRKAVYTKIAASCRRTVGADILHDYMHVHD